MRKWILLAAFVASIVMLASTGAYVLWPQPDRITKANYERIEEGMTRAEVEALLGPPGNYQTGPMNLQDPQVFGLFPMGIPPDFCDAWETSPDPDERLIRGWWQGNEGCIMVVCTPKVVLHKLFINGTRKEQGLLDNFLWRAKRRWQKLFPQ